MRNSKKAVWGRLDDDALHRTLVPIITFDKKEFPSKMAAWKQLLEIHPEVPLSHWRKKHRYNTWGWYAVEKCEYSGCKTCYKALEKEDDSSYTDKKG